MAAPYLSFVMFARNDGYGHDGTARLQHSLDSLCAQLGEFRLEAEVVIVDWNPPRDAPTLAEILRLPSAAPGVSVRTIVVPERFHARYRCHAEKGMHVAAAFNVGLRRARGQFVLPRPSDVYYTAAVLERIARRALDERTIYRVDRFDRDAAGCVVHHHARLETPEQFDIRDLHTNACGDFSLMSKSLWFEVRGWQEGDSVAALDVDSLALHGAAAAGAREEIWPDPCRVYKTVHGAITIRRVQQVFRRYEQRLDDFVRGRYSSRAQNRVRMLLDFPRRRIAGLTPTFPSFERNFLRRAQRWAAGRKPYYLNGRQWGLPGESFEERALRPPAS